MCKINYKCFNDMCDTIKSRFMEFIEINNAVVAREFMSRIDYKYPKGITANYNTCFDLYIVFDNVESSYVDVNINDNKLTFCWNSSGKNYEITMDIIMFNEGSEYWAHVISDRYSELYVRYLML